VLPSDITQKTDGEDIEEIARTLAVEHEAAARKHTEVFVLTEAAPGQAPPAPAHHLPSPYSDLGEVARGGMGAVLKAFDPDLQRLVAIKMMLPSLAKNDFLARKFVDEARITALIDHPNIAPVYRLAKGEDGALSLVMKLIEGRTLTQHLHSVPRGPWAKEALDHVLSIFVKICDAVAFAHSRKVIHLDLKPDNIMLGPYGQVYVVDWGIARYRPGPSEPSLLMSLSPRDASTGTPAYMSPEQALRIDAHITEQTDVFLLGGILYEILTGHRPHPGRTMVEVVTAAIRGAIIPPAERAPHRAIPQALAAMAMRALAARPHERYPGVLDLQREIVAFQRGGEWAPRRTYPEGALVLREGEPGDEAFAIVSGRCLVTAMSEGRRVVLRELGPGDVFGETAVFSDEPRSATVEAIEPLEVRVVTGETLSQTLGLQTWAGAFVKALAERFRDADRRARE
jgi:serine/threonine-protein kinase